MASNGSSTLSPPLGLLAELTHRCPLGCPYCSNPLALEPLFAWAVAETLLSDDAEAEKLYMRAVRLQPLNSRSWFELGRFELAHGDSQQGRAFLRRAAQLDSQGPAKSYR